MAREIERKFLVGNDSWKAGSTGMLCRQGYLATSATVTVRVRVLGERAYLTIKGKTEGIARDEFEYEIPRTDAEAMLATVVSGHLVEKVRYRVLVGGMVWEVDEFLGENSGLVVAEIELADEEQQFVLPPWVGQEVTGDVRYYNAMLAKEPYLHWK